MPVARSLRPVLQTSRCAYDRLYVGNLDHSLPHRVLTLPGANLILRRGHQRVLHLVMQLHGCAAGSLDSFHLHNSKHVLVPNRDGQAHPIHFPQTQTRSLPILHLRGRRNPEPIPDILFPHRERTFGKKNLGRFEPRIFESR